MNLWTQQIGRRAFGHFVHEPQAGSGAIDRGKNVMYEHLAPIAGTAVWSLAPRRARRTHWRDEGQGPKGTPGLVPQSDQARLKGDLGFYHFR